MVINIQPKTSSPKGQSYPNWIRTFWQKLCPIPKSQSPAVNNNGSKDANLNPPNSGSLYFLSFSRDPQSSQVRNITVPAGTELFLPVMSVIVSECERAGATDNQLVQLSNKHPFKLGIVFPPAVQDSFSATHCPSTNEIVDAAGQSELSLVKKSKTSWQAGLNVGGVVS